MSLSNDSTIVALPHRGGGKRPDPPVAFHRTELSAILNIYGRMVAAGEWKDYGITTGKDQAIFAIFRKAGEMPLYRIQKTPKLSRKQGAWSIIGMSGQILKRGHGLDQVLKVLETRALKLIEN